MFDWFEANDGYCTECGAGFWEDACGEFCPNCDSSRPVECGDDEDDEDEHADD